VARVNERERDLDQLLNHWVDLGPTVAPDRVAAAASLEIRSTRQSPALLAGLAERFPIMNSTTARFSIVAAAVVVAGIIGLGLLPENIGDPQPTPTPAPSTQPLAGTFVLEPGRYSIGGVFPVDLTFEIPADGWTHNVWEGGVNGAYQRVVCKGGDACSVAVSFLIVTDLPKDSCQVGLGRMGVGPTVDDLVDALVARPLWDIEEPTDIVIDGYAGTLVAIRAPEASALSDCDGPLENYYANVLARSNLPGEGSRLHILEVDGVRLVIDVVDYPNTSEQDLAELQQILDSIDIEQASSE
jgi:hypothetical protein